MTKEEMINILTGIVRFDDVESCQKQLDEIAEYIKASASVVMCRDCRFCEKMVHDCAWWCNNPNAFNYHYMNELTTIKSHENGCLLGERKQGEHE